MAEPEAKGSARTDVEVDSERPVIYVRTAWSGQCWFLVGDVSGSSLEWLVDTGASPNVLDRSRYLSMPDSKRPPLQPVHVSLRAADGGPLQIYGKCALEVVFAGQPFQIPVIVADLGPLPGILGMWFLECDDFCFDIRRGRLSTPRGEMYLVRKEGSNCCRVSMSETMVIPPGHEVVFEGLLEGHWDVSDCSPGLIEAEPSLLENTGLLVASAVVEVGGPSVTLMVANVTDDPIEVGKGTTVGRLQPAVLVPEEAARPPTNGMVPGHLQGMIADAAPALTDTQLTVLTELIARNQDVFVGPDGKLGRTTLVKHHIDTGDTRPIKQRLRRVSDTKRKVIEEEVGKMLEQDIIAPSNSAWASPVVLAKKKGGNGVRFCLDYRMLNQVSRKDAYPLPNIGECMDALSGAQWFCTLDLASGYWQVELEDASKDKTAFTTHKGLYHFNVLPFGLTNAPATFERLMEHVLRGLQWEKCLLYLDDIIIVGKTFEETVENFEAVLARLRGAGLKLKPSKCCLMRRKVAFLGHIVSPEGVSCDPEKVSEVADWETPQNLTELRAFVGLATYYRKFVPGFARVAEPLTALTRKGVPYEWTPSCEQAFQALKQKLVEAPILAYPSPDPDAPFVLDTDASDMALGAVLSQVQGGTERVIAYASKTLSAPQRNYCTTYKELLAVVLFVKHFKHYLSGRKFTIRTDHSSLRWLINFRDAEGMVARWITYLSTFDFEIVHRRGTSHGNADGLSRKTPRRRRCGRDHCPECHEVTDLGIPECVRGGWTPEDPGEQSGRGWEPESGEGVEEIPDQPQETPVEQEHSLCAMIGVGQAGSLGQTNAGVSSSSRDTRQNQGVDMPPGPGGDPPDAVGVWQPNWLDAYSIQDLRQLQAEYGPIKQVAEMIDAGQGCPDRTTLLSMGEAVRALCSQWEDLTLREGILYRSRTPPYSPTAQLQYVVPPVLRKDIMRNLHDTRTSGHLGVKRTVESIKRRYYWPGCKTDVARWCQACKECSQIKPAPKRGAPLHQQLVGAPLDRVAIDILGELPETERGNKYILVISDYFTKWTQAFALPNQTAQSVADILCIEFFSLFGCPLQLHSDQGRNFESELFAEVCRLLGVEKTRTTAYRPQSDGQVERFNRTIQQMLKAFVNDNRDDWDDHLPYLTMAYRATVHESTGCSPNLLMLGREVSLPLDVMMGPPPQATLAYQSQVEYVEWLRVSLQSAFQHAHQQLQKSANRQKRNYDLKVKRCTRYQEGQLVWRWYPPYASRKLGKGWTGPYKIVQRPNDMHCVLQRSPGHPRVRVHVDLLQPYLGSVPPVWEKGEEPDVEGREHALTHFPESPDNNPETEAVLPELTDGWDDRPDPEPPDRPDYSPDVLDPEPPASLEPFDGASPDSPKLPSRPDTITQSGEKEGRGEVPNGTGTSSTRRRRGSRIRRAPHRLDL